jgi:hypothetical protein
MGKYIKPNVVFNRDNKRHMRIWNWVIDMIGENGNFSDFARDCLEWRMEWTKEKTPIVEESMNKTSIGDHWEDML